MITMVCVPVRKQRPQEGEGLVEVGLGWGLGPGASRA